MFINFKCSQTHPPSTYLSKSKQAILQIKNLSFNKLKTYLIVLSNSNELNKKKKIKFSQIYEEEEQGLTSLIHFAAHNTLELDLARCNDIHSPPPPSSVNPWPNSGGEGCGKDGQVELGGMIGHRAIWWSIGYRLTNGNSTFRSDTIFGIRDSNSAREGEGWAWRGAWTGFITPGSVKTSVTPPPVYNCPYIARPIGRRLINGIIDRIPPSFSARFSITIRRVYRQWIDRDGRCTWVEDVWQAVAVVILLSAFDQPPPPVSSRASFKVAAIEREKFMRARRSSFFLHGWYGFYERFKCHPSRRCVPTRRVAFHRV